MKAPVTAATDPLLATLNEQQRQVVSAPLGRARLVLAGPGSGKTRTLVHRVARLLRDGVPADRVLLVTFTNKAAHEMMARCEALCGSAAWSLMGGTFHGLATKLLRQYGGALGLDPEFRILDRADTEEQLRAAVWDLQLDARRDGLPRVRTLGRIYSAAVQRELSLADVLTLKWPQYAARHDLIEAIGAQFVRRKHEAGVLDFDDLLVGWSLLVDPPDDAGAAVQEATAALRARFVEVLVDEYQDTNAIQGRIADHMARHHGGLTVVGDDCQGIYGFRGADASNLMGFSERFPNAERMLLTHNYRSTPEIIELANQSIAHNTRRLEKELVPVRAASDVPPWVVQCRDRQEEARFIVAKALAYRDEGVPWSQIAVLYRSHALSSDLQVELTRAGVPFVIRSGVRFFEQAHIKDVLAYGRALLGDELGLRRLLLLYPGVGAVTADRIVLAFRSGASLTDLAAAEARPGAHSALQLLAHVAQGGDLSVAESLSAIVDHYAARFVGRFDDAQQRSEDLEELVRFARTFQSFAELFADLPVARQTGRDGGDEEALVLSSIHQAKGLEWSRVFVLSLIEGNLPHAASFAEADGVDEERRLFYVAVTRAADELLLTYAQRAGRERLQMPSRFLSELMPSDQTPPFSHVRPAFD